MVRTLHILKFSKDFYNHLSIPLPLYTEAQSQLNLYHTTEKKT